MLSMPVVPVMPVMPVMRSSLQPESTHHKPDRPTCPGRQLPPSHGRGMHPLGPGQHGCHAGAAERLINGPDFVFIA